jgi:hypothetical protein
MSTLKTPFRYDFVGSFLRPQKLKDAKADFAAGKITQDELEKITDDCVRDIVAKQKAAGFHAITDGEFRRKFWHLDFMWGFEVLLMRKRAAEFSLMERWQTLKPLILLAGLRQKNIHLWNILNFLSSLRMRIQWLNIRFLHLHRCTSR